MSQNKNNIVMNTFEPAEAGFFSFDINSNIKNMGIISNISKIFAYHMINKGVNNVTLISLQ
ncbi:hypothetical protein [Metamycoplasma buccale]|uniref:hypothetical protein n=1 Tax=Metamycoplasma buccale TaxID=55602 RepID=UPI00398ED0F8